MKATELRIGNWIMLNGFLSNDLKGIVKEVAAVGLDIDFTDGTTQQLISIEPIPLTEGWLIKFGFNKYGTDLKCYDTDNFWEIRDDGSDYGYWINQLEIYVKYVHQLQNLYFALTGEELTI